jgi:chemotaxis protein methyltransferase CheR
VRGVASRVGSTRELEEHLPRVSTFVAERTGLHFPPDRFRDLVRGLEGARRELGFDDVVDLARWLVSSPISPAQLQILASHLTIGETYFFREPAMWDVLRHRVLPDLIQARRGGEQRLRLWSAGCASGEEPYTLAILLHQLLPDLPQWHVTILGTDINTRFLRKAAAGAYGDWSFRGASQTIKTAYFTQTADHFTIREDIQRLVTFEHLNLVEDVYPSLATETNAMDIILCRNVLMYFTPSHLRTVIGKLHGALIEDGWLVVSPSEASATWFPQFVSTTFPNAILFRKRERPAGAEHQPVSRGSRSQPEPPSPPGRSASSRPLRAAPTLSNLPALTRALANEGRLDEALACCDQWVALDRLSAPAHYIRGMVLLEQGDFADARRSLQRTLYLDPKFVLAHFASGTLAATQGRHQEALKHFANTQRLLAELSPDAILPESDGLTAGRLAQTLAVLSGTDATHD